MNNMQLISNWEMIGHSKSFLRHFDTRSWLKLNVSVVLLTLVVSSQVLFAQDVLDKPELADILPSSTHLVVGTSNVAASYEAIEKSSIGKGFSSPVWLEVAATQSKRQVGSLLNPSPWIGVNWSDVSSVATPGAVFVFSRNKEELAFAFVSKLGADGKNPALNKIFEVNGGADKFQSSKLGATQFWVKAGKDAKSRSVCIAVGKTWCCVSSSTDAIKEWLSLKSKGGSTTSSARSEVQTWSKNSKPGQISFWLSSWELLKANASAIGNPKLLQSADIYGMPGLGEVRGVLTPSPDTQSQWGMRYQTTIAQPPKNGLALLSFRTGKLPKLPNFPVGSMDFVSAYYLDIKPWFAGVNFVVDRMIDEDTPGNFGDILDSILTDPEGPKIDVRKELIYRSGPLMMQFSASRPDATVPEKVVREKVYVCALQDPAGAAKVVKSLFKDDEDVRFETIGPYQCWNAENDESLFVSLAKGENQVLCVAAVDDANLYLSTNTVWFKKLLSERGGQPSVLWSEFSRGVSTDFSARHGVDLSSWLERSWARIPEPESQEYRSVDGPSMLLTKTLVPGLTASELPKWSQIRSQFGLLVHNLLQNGNQMEGDLLLAMPNK